MSQENVEIVQRAFAEFEKGNFWVPEFFDPAVRIVWRSVVGGDVETVGLSEMSRATMNWMQSWDEGSPSGSSMPGIAWSSSRTGVDAARSRVS